MSSSEYLLAGQVSELERLKLQSVQGDSKLVIEADGAMQAVVRGMLKEIAGARDFSEFVKGRCGNVARASQKGAPRPESKTRNHCSSCRQPRSGRAHAILLSASA